MRFNTCLAALAATFVVATPAYAASTATATAEARGVVLQSLTLSKTKDLDFGTVAGDPNAGGDVIIDPDTGARTTTGAVVGLAGAFQRAQFDGFATPNVNVQVSMTQPPSGVLCNGAGCVNKINAVLNMDNGGPGVRSSGPTGAFSVFVGGDFTLAAAQPAGLYTAQFDVTAVYP